MRRQRPNSGPAWIVLLGALSLPACATVQPAAPALLTAERGEHSVVVAVPPPPEPHPLAAAILPPPRPGERSAVTGGAADTSPFGPASWWHDAMSVAPERLATDMDLVRADYGQYYSMGNMVLFGLGVGAAAPLANTSADESVAHWYQRRVRGATSDEFSQVINYAGQFWLVLPVFVEGAALMGQADDGYWHDGGLGEWSNRSLRAVAVGVPPMLAMYVVLGSGRPDRHDSYWHPFNDIRGVSGHTFVGAVPFLTAAAMTDEPLWQVPLVAGSMATGWSRINDDRHYLSQVVLGWWLAYLAVRSVSEGQAAMRSVTLAPAIFDDGAGVAIGVRY